MDRSDTVFFVKLSSKNNGSLAVRALECIPAHGVPISSNIKEVKLYKLDKMGDSPHGKVACAEIDYGVLVASGTPLVAPTARHAEANELANHPDNSAGPFVLHCGCGRSVTTSTPLAPGARYACGCSFSRREKSRLTRIRNEARNNALLQRLEPFLKLPLEGHQREWFELAQELKVDPVALEVLVAIVQEAKWQKSTAPLMFVRVNVERRSEEWQDPFTEDGQLHHPQIFSPLPRPEDRTWLKQWTRFQEWNAQVTPKDIEAASPTLSVVQDEEERAVICARALGLTRAQYLSGVGDAERRRRAAAWKRLSRHGIPAELRKALRGASGDRAIIRPGYEEREWRDIRDYGRQDELPAKATAVPRYDF